MICTIVVAFYVSRTHPWSGNVIASGFPLLKRAETCSTRYQRVVARCGGALWDVVRVLVVCWEEWK
jgi:hypothetical protein